ncbi:alcohol dehydrogenase, zinc-containing, putative [Paecilomyces variotii No. 5]|uniref:Alcohol dehydrogenase, zinc-containing, putative n=1 Tax=Byssochlamys spectabilis (strain No. 5 / NBRC 109023) TaxID=1356009 RepID=V5GAU2_BYSSN|nr:alcohol dehydrogenase, zinc-containing, putative [Paecilomyces variotii No. 5]
MSTTVKQWVTAQDGLDNLQMTQADMPTPGDTEVLVEIRAVSLNYRDTEVSMGQYNHHRDIKDKPTVVPCSDMCGIITAIGPGISDWKVGDRVLSTFNQTHLTGQITSKDMPYGLGFPLPGVLATHRVFPEYGLVKAPEYLSDEEASTLPIAAVTAWMSINGMRPLEQNGGEGEIVLLQGTGGVSIAGLQIAKASGAKAKILTTRADETVIILSSSDTKLAQAKSLGADYTINYRTQPDWENEVMKLTADHGADIILETGGARTLRKSFDCVAWGGLINSIGYLSGKEDDPGDRMNVNLLALRRTVTLKGILNGPKDRFEEVLAFYEKHRIRPVVSRVFGFEEGKEALKFLYSGGHFGKVVVRVK